MFFNNSLGIMLLINMIERNIMFLILLHDHH